MTLTLSNLIIIGLIGVCAWLAGKWFFKKDTEIENRRRAAIQLAATLKGMGFVDLPEFFIDYGVGDYSGMLYKLKAIAQKMMSGEKGVLAELSDVFETLLKIKLATQEGRMLVKSELEAYEKMLAPAAPAPAAPAPAAPAPAAPAPADPTVVNFTPEAPVAVAPIDVEKLVQTVAEVALTVPAAKPAE